MNAIPNKPSKQNKLELEKQQIKKASLEAAQRAREIAVVAMLIIVVLPPPIDRSTGWG